MDEVTESRPRAVEEPPRRFLGSSKRRLAARVIAVLVDALQIVLFPAFFPGIVSPFDRDRYHRFTGLSDAIRYCVAERVTQRLSWAKSLHQRNTGWIVSKRTVAVDQHWCS